MSLVEDFIKELDAAWTWPEPRKIRLRIIGSAALMLQTNYQRGTKDSDVLETVELSPETQSRLRTLAGPGSHLHNRKPALS